jgi:PAS domain S-box-containing protein
LTRIREAGKSRAAHDGEPIYLELECVHKNGDRAWCEAFTKPLLDGHSEVIGTIAAIRNITERKEAEHALKASERRYREYVDNAPVAFFVSNAAGKHLDVNRAATSLLGYTREELMALPVQVLDVTDDASGTDALQYLKRNGYIRGERQPRHKHGHSVDVLLEAVAISDDRYMAYCQDITHQKNTERRLELYKQAIQSSDDLVAAVDKGYRYMMASPAYLQQHRIDEQDLLGTHVADILGSEAFREVVQPRLDQALNGERLSYEMSLRYPDGVLHEVHVSYYPLRDAEHVTGVIAQIRDIHEIKNR